MLSDLLVVLVVAAAVIFPALGQTQFLQPHELRHCEISREMCESHDHIVPHLLGEVYHDKPPVMHNVAAGIMHWWGQPTVFIGRLPSALAGVGVVLMTYGLGRVLSGRRLGLVSALALLSLPGFVIMSRQARPDMTLCFAIVASCLALALGMRSYRNGVRAAWFAAAGATVGLGVITKGPYGLLFPIFFVVLMPIRRVEWRRPRFGWLGFAVAMLSVAAVWAIPAYQRDEGQFLKEVVFQRDLDVTQKASSWYNLIAPAIFLSLPLGIFLPMALRDLRRHGYSGPLACAGAILAVVQAVPKKRAHYLVPMYPFLALGLAMTILRHGVVSKQVRRTACVAMALGAAIVPVYFGIVAPLFENAEDPDLQMAREVLTVLEPHQPIYTLIAEAEPLAWLSRSYEELVVLDLGGPKLASQLHTLPIGAYVVVPEDYQAQLLKEAGALHVHMIATVDWPRHKLETILRPPKPHRHVNVLRIESRDSPPFNVHSHHA